jgi:hypothetical protein
MTPHRRTAIFAGVFYLITHVTSIAALVLYNPMLHDAAYVTGAGADSRIALGAFMELLLAIGIIGTAVTLFPVVKRQNESIALGYVGLRTLEAATVILGMVTLLAVVTLRRPDAGGTDATALQAVAKGLVAVHDWAFLLGPDLVLGVNTVCMAYLMYRSGLVPRFIGALGLVGGPLVFVAAIGVLFGLYSQMSPVVFGAAVPVFGWELSLALWLIIKGFKPGALQRAAAVETTTAAA